MAPKYDDAAFSYFAITALSLYAVPAGLWLTSCLLSFMCSKKSKDMPAAVTAAQKKQFEEEQAKMRSWKQLLTTGFVVNAVLFSLAAIALFFLMQSIAQDGQVAVYDPFTVLGVDSGSTDRVIKKAYRALSLKYHPDKNIDDPEAAEMFLKVAKAYEALTDPVAAENYRLYGNPDGKQAMEVSLGLPTLFMDKGKQKTVLLIYILILAVTVPVIVYYCSKKSETYDEKGVRNDTHAYMHQSLRANLNVRNLPELLVTLPEFWEMPLKCEREVDKVMSLAKRLRNENWMQRPQRKDFDKTRFFPLYVALHGYLNQMELTPAMLEDVHALLRKADMLLDIMLERTAYKMSLEKHANSRMPFVTTMFNIMEFSARLTQAVWVDQSELLQLPHFTPVEVYHCSRGKPKCDTLRAYLKTQKLADVKKGTRDLTDNQKAEVDEFLGTVPDLQVDVVLEVEGEDGLHHKDVVTMKVTITHANVPEDEDVPPVHSPRFPYVKTERWWLMLIENAKAQRLIGQSRVKDPNLRVATQELKFMAPKPGKHQYILNLRSGSYVGLDQSITVDFVTEEPRPEAEAHEDDIELENEVGGSFWDQLNGTQPEGSDLDDTDDEEEDEEPTVAGASSGDDDVPALADRSDSE